MRNSMKILAELATVFLKIGLFTFGGGYAMLPLLQSELVEKRKWVSSEQLMDYFCIGQSTPGIIAVNVATFIGYNRGNIPGAIIATLSLITMPVIIILSLANILTLYMENQYVIKAFEGIRIVVVALIAEAVFKLWKAAVTSKFSAVIFVIALIAAINGVSPVMIVLAACFLALICMWREKKK